MMVNKIYQMIALCQKARMLVTGEFACKQAVLQETVVMVIVAADASENTKKLFRDKCHYRNIPCIEWGMKEEFGRILGKEVRAVVGITDKGFANKISEMLSSIQ